ncbi:melanopsin [Hydra vulgaris]|uniref:Melanopsin n=1 Tax=Hydra vulgaris TaxID=6087 RepID=A0ABM4D503_HYDVU
MEHETWISLLWTKPIASSFICLILFTALTNIYVVWSIYKKRNLRNSSTAIIVANLACVDILVTLKDLPTFFSVAVSGHWVFEESWCASYGLTNVIFIVVSVSTLVTITTDKFSRLREMAIPQEHPSSNTHHPLILGYVIAHTTLSYSLSLLWSKYVFVTRKSFCRVEWPPRNGLSATFLSSFVFIVPVSFLIYNLLYTTVLKVNDCEKVKIEANPYEKKAQHQLHIAVSIFLLSWTPYVLESIISSHSQISPLTGIFTASIPLLTTSLLPFLYIQFLIKTLEKTSALCVVVQ